MMMFGLSASLAAVLIRPLGGLLLLVLIVVPARIEVGSQSLTALELAIPVCLFIELKSEYLRSCRRPIPPSVVTVLVLIFYFLALSSGFWAQNGGLWLHRVVPLTEGLAVGWAVYLAVSRLGTLAFVRVMAWSSTLGATWALIWFYVLGRPTQFNLQPPSGLDAAISQSLRLGSPLFGPSNYYAGFLIMTIPTTFYLCQRDKRYWLAIAIQVAALTATLSRGAIGLVLAVLIVLALRSALTGRLPHGFTFVSVAIVAVVLSPLAPGAVNTLLAHRQETVTTNAGFESRADLWGVAFDLWRGNPYLGVGAGNWDGAVTARYRGGAHNSLLQILAELGMLGLAVAVLAFCAILMATLRIRDSRLRLCLLAGILGSFINTLSEATFEGVVFTWFLGAFLGGVLATSVEDR